VRERKPRVCREGGKRERRKEAIDKRGREREINAK
jgi:hypothetical protein